MVTSQHEYIEIQFQVHMLAGLEITPKASKESKTSHGTMSYIPGIYWNRSSCFKTRLVKSQHDYTGNRNPVCGLGLTGVKGIQLRVTPLSHIVTISVNTSYG